MTLLTDKQFKILLAIKNYIKQNSYSPSLGDLQQMTGIKTKHGIAHYIEQLEKKGYITRSGNYRGIKIVKHNLESSLFISIPLLGYANCGRPLVFAEQENLGTLQVSPDLVAGKKNVFAVMTKGDSMNRKEINGKKLDDNKYAVIDKDASVNDKDAVLAIIDNSATIKTLIHDDETVILYPESTNPVHQPIYLQKEDDALIQGKVIAVLNNPMES